MNMQKIHKRNSLLVIAYIHRTILSKKTFCFNPGDRAQKNMSIPGIWGQSRIRNAFGEGIFSI
jgi:hypothetical protein